MINLEIALRCRVAYKGLIDGMRAKISANLLPEGRFITLPNTNGGSYRFYIGKSDGTNLQNVLIWEFDHDQELVSQTVAQRGVVETVGQNLAGASEGTSVKTTSATAAWRAQLHRPPIGRLTPNPRRLPPKSRL